MVLGILTSGRPLAVVAFPFSGPRFCVSKRFTVLVMLNVSPGFVLLVFILLCLLVLKSCVVVSFFFVLVCPLSIFRLMMPVVLCCVNSVSMVNCFVWSPCMPPIAILQETNFLSCFLLGLILQSPQLCVEILTPFFIVRLIVPDLWLLTLLERVLLLSLGSLMNVVSLTPGGTYILPPLVTPG